MGLVFDTEALEIRLPRNKVDNIMDILRTWKHKSTFTKHQLQQILGKLMFVSQYINLARLYVARMLETLHEAPQHGYITLIECFRRDVMWDIAFLPNFVRIAV